MTDDDVTSAGASISRRFRDLAHVIGNTPLVAIEMLFRDEPRRVFAKVESLNMTGSIKDRMGLRVLRSAYDDGRLEPGMRIVEATSGNTGISLAAIGRALGHQVTIFMPDWLSRERADLMLSLGADVRLVSREEGGFPTCLARCDDLAATEPCFLPRQFENEDNSSAHETTTGPEIWSQLQELELEPDAFVAGVGTGGTVMGVGRALRRRRASVRVHPLEPASSPTLSTGHKVGVHRIEGISDEFVPPILDLGWLDEILAVDDGDAILMAQRLAAELGLGVGISSGANILGALMIQDTLGAGAVVVTVLPDDNKKYLSTDLLGREPVADGYLSPQVRLLGLSAVRRACEQCRTDDV
jgi:cysteine synthase